MKVRKNTACLENLFVDGRFQLDTWKSYTDDFMPGLCELAIEDASDYDFERDVVPVLHQVVQDTERVHRLEKLFDEITCTLDQKIAESFGKNLDCELILHLGLCNGAGWVVTLNGQTKVVLGIEKIIELGWDAAEQLRGLIYHELGHVYQGQFGVLYADFENPEDGFSWQLYTEGVATYFEQTLVDDYSFFHEDKDGWQEKLEGMLPQLKTDFNDDATRMTNCYDQRYFGDWVSYHGYPNAGYYLGAKFVQYICRERAFNTILSLTIEEVKGYYSDFLHAE